MADLINKKRDLMPKLNDCIQGLIDLSFDIAKLEITDNNQASIRAKRQLAEFKRGPLDKLTEALQEARRDIIMRPKSPNDGRSNNGRNLPVKTPAVLPPHGQHESNIEKEEDF